MRKKYKINKIAKYQKKIAVNEKKLKKNQQKKKKRGAKKFLSSILQISHIIIKRQQAKKRASGMKCISARECEWESRGRASSAAQMKAQTYTHTLAHGHKSRRQLYKAPADRQLSSQLSGVSERAREGASGSSVSAAGYTLVLSPRL